MPNVERIYYWVAVLLILGAVCVGVGVGRQAQQRQISATRGEALVTVGRELVTNVQAYHSLAAKEYGRLSEDMGRVVSTLNNYAAILDNHAQVLGYLNAVLLTNGLTLTPDTVK